MLKKGHSNNLFESYETPEHLNIKPSLITIDSPTCSNIKYANKSIPLS